MSDITVTVNWTVIEERQGTFTVPDGDHAAITDAVDQRLFAHPHAGEETRAQQVAFTWTEAAGKRFGGRTL